MNENYDFSLGEGNKQIKVSLMSKDEEETETAEKDKKGVNYFSGDNIDKEIELNPKNLKLSQKSKKLIVIRVLILFLMCIYFPLETIFSPNFNELEDKLIFKKVSKILPAFLTENNLVICITDWFFYLSSDKDIITLYTAVLYMVYHPFTAIKIMLVTHFIQFWIVIMRCMFHAVRPIWNVEGNAGTYLCTVSYGSPSMHCFFTSFFYFYLILSMCMLKRKRKGMNLGKKMSIFVIVILIALISASLNIIKRLNYIYQLNFAFTISMVLVCLVIDIDNFFHNYILKSLKNLVKIRKHKIQLFFIVLAMNILGVFVYNFLTDEMFDIISTSSVMNKNCSPDQLSNTGLRSTFTEITFSYGILGTFWGTSLTVEKNCGEWWNSNKKNLLLKVIIVLLFGGSYVFIFCYIFTASFEFNYFIQALKYIFFNYILMGWVPLLFDRAGLNHKIKKNYVTKKSVFSMSFYGFEKDKKNIEDEDKDEDVFQRRPFTKSIIVDGLHTKKDNDHLEFMVNQNNSMEEK